MIFLIEPICRNHSHEVFNCGSIELFRKAFPEEKISFVAHKSHLDAVIPIYSQNTSDKTNSINWVEKRWPKRWHWLGYLQGAMLIYAYAKLWKRNEDIKIVFLSFDNMILSIIKYFFRAKNENKNPLLLFLHRLEDCDPSDKGNPRETTKHSIAGKSFITNLILEVTSRPLATMRKALNIAERRFAIHMGNLFQYFFFPDFCDNLRLDPDHPIKYVVLSDHISSAVAEIPRLRSLPIVYIPLPRVFKAWEDLPSSGKPVFGVFGYGFPNAIEKILRKLESLPLILPYEIRLIGNMPRHFSKYRNVFMSESEGILTRQEMEEMNRDVNIQLILYPQDSYKLSCSASIFEALAYNKPILHVKNFCIDFYNQPEHSIGYREEDLDGVIQRMVTIINHYSTLISVFEQFQSNLKIVRNKFSIDSSVPRIHAIYK